MNFEIGDKVKVARRGKLLKYSYGYSAREIPIGSRGVVSNAYHHDELRVIIKGSQYFFREDELECDTDTARRNACSADNLTSLLSSEELASAPSATTPAGNSHGILSKLRDFLGIFSRKQTDAEIPYISPSDSRQNTKSGKINPEKFNPKFNAREEFALWIREQFPELLEKEGNYQIPENRRDEVYEAARQACEHGIKTACSCIRNGFEAYLEYLQESYEDNFRFKHGSDKDNYEFKHRICSLVNLIESVSANLPAKDAHYGTELAWRKK